MKGFGEGQTIPNWVGRKIWEKTETQRVRVNRDKGETNIDKNPNLTQHPGKEKKRGSG